MKNCNTNKDFIKYANSHWYKRKDIEAILNLLKEFISSSIAIDKNFILTWIVSFRIKETTTTLRPWIVFKKVKAFVSDKILELTKYK